MPFAKILPRAISSSNNILNVTFCYNFHNICLAQIAVVRIIIIIMYLYSAQYLHILQDSKRYLTNLTVQVQPQLTSN